MLKTIALVTVALFALPLACSPPHTTDSTRDLDATVEAAVEATIESRATPTLETAPTSFASRSTTPLPEPIPTPTPTPTLISTPTPSPTYTPTPTPRPTYTPSPTATPIPFNITEAHCQREDFGEAYADGYGITDTVGPEQWDAHAWRWRESFSTNWSGLISSDSILFDVSCRTVIYDSIDNARWSLNYSTAVQRAWSRADLELLVHRQVIVPTIIGEESLMFQIEAGPSELLSPSYTSTTVMFQRGNVVVAMTSSFSCNTIAPLFCDSFLSIHSRHSIEVLPNIAQLVDVRVLEAQLEQMLRTSGYSPQY